MFNVPILFCVFNRLDTTIKVFEKIRKIKPIKLYIVSDAPRESRPDEDKKVYEVRDYIENSIDWECEVHKNYATKNMGCGKRISSGISWAFEQEEELIILEDDCIPDLSFFRYCQEMLEYYKDDTRILMIGGNNPVGHLYSSKYDYLFSHVPFMWGWATWKRSWELYDYYITSWKDNKNNPIIKKSLSVRSAYMYYTAQFEYLSKGLDNGIWDYQFMYVGIINSMYGILPTCSLVNNIGFSEESTHTKESPKWMNKKVSEMSFPIQYRKGVEWDKDFDEIYFRLYTKNGLILKLKSSVGLDVNRSIKDIIHGRIKLIIKWIRR